MRDRVEFPPVDVFYDGESHWLADGYHRLAAAAAAGLEEIRARVHQGGSREATFFACGANISHGLRRTNADKRKGAVTLLTDPEWSQNSDRELSRLLGVSQPFITQLRFEIESSDNGFQMSPKRLVRRGEQVYRMEVRTGRRGPEREMRRADSRGAGEHVRTSTLLDTNKHLHPVIEPDSQKVPFGVEPQLIGPQQVAEQPALRPKPVEELREAELQLLGEEPTVEESQLNAGVAYSRLWDLADALSRAADLEPAKVAANAVPDMAMTLANRLSTGLPWLEQLISALRHRSTPEPITLAQE